MAPRKRKAPAEPPATKPEKRVTRSTTHAAMRLTRSGSKYGSIPISGSGSGSGSPGPEKSSEKKEKNTQGVEVAGQYKKVKLEKKEEGVGKSEAASSTRIGKTIIIERCTQCQSFSRRSKEVKDGLQEKIPGITIKVNPQKPRKGCFEIREEGGEKFISLLNLKRPFQKMKDLDMNNVISDIVKKINGQDTGDAPDTGGDVADTGDAPDTGDAQDTN